MSGIAAGIVCLFLAALVLVGLLTFTALLGAAAVLVLGFGMIVADFWSGVIWIGCGILLLGLGLLGVALSVVVYGKLIPWCIRTAVDAVSRVLHRGRRQSA